MTDEEEEEKCNEEEVEEEKYEEEEEECPICTDPLQVDLHRWETFWLWTSGFFFLIVAR